eukprot:gene18559-biopygen15638
MLRVIISTILLSSLLLHVRCQVTCTDPIVIAELRVLKSKKCVDISGNEGAGSIGTHECDGYRDQQIIFCGDGTIRNQATNFCFTPTNPSESSGSVTSSRCILLPEIPEHQKWRVGKTKVFTDNGGIEQEAKEIINVENGKCLDVSGRSGEGGVNFHECEDMDDQYFYFRSRGEQLGFGRLINEESDLCLDVKGDKGGKLKKNTNVLTYECEDQMDQWFRYYENGELLNEESKWCVEVSGSSGSGNIIVHNCEDLKDQMWTRPEQLCNDEFCSFRNKKSGLCMDVPGTGGNGNIATADCDALPDQRFKWITKKWTVPKAKWNLVACNQNGKVTHAISNSVSYSRTITASVTVTVGAEMEAGVVFAKAKTSISVSASLASAWTSSSTETKKTTLSCDNYSNGDAFTGGCMWQLELKMKEAVSQEELAWKPQIVKCTRRQVEPQCPPFTKCIDKDCTGCEEINERRK